MESWLYKSWYWQNWDFGITISRPKSKLMKSWFRKSWQWQNWDFEIYQLRFQEQNQLVELWICKSWHWPNCDFRIKIPSAKYKLDVIVIYEIAILPKSFSKSGFTHKSPSISGLVWNCNFKNHDFWTKETKFEINLRFFSLTFVIFNRFQVNLEKLRFFKLRSPSISSQGI